MPYLLALLLLVAPVVANPVPSPTPYKHRVVDGVCQRIAAACGDPLARPRLVMRRRAGVAARFDTGPWQTLYFDERLYDLCRQYGPDSLNALACVVGHEMAHFYQQQGAGMLFGRPAGMAARGAAVSRKQTEAEADRFGLYYGYLAGYDTYRLLPAVLTTVYRAYGLPDHLPGYPTRPERAAISVQEQRRFQPLALAFEAGQLLWLTQHDEEATVCLQYVLAQFRSKEVYNNLGVVRLGQALRQLPRHRALYAYPFEWDAANRLRLGTLRSDPPPHMATYLQEAKTYFKAALQIDPSYAAAGLNLACTHSLLDNQEAALGTLQELTETLGQRQQPLPANGWLIRAIAYAQNAQPDRATACFAQAVRQGAFQATYNRGVFQRLQTSTDKDPGAGWASLQTWLQRVWATPTATIKPLPRDEGVGTFRFASWPAIAPPDTLLLPHATHPVSLLRQTAPGQTALRLLTADHALTVLTATAGHRGQSRTGLRVGLPATDLTRRCGPPDAVLPVAGGRQFWHYKSGALIVDVSNGQVRGWHLYRY